MNAKKWTDSVETKTQEKINVSSWVVNMIEKRQKFLRRMKQLFKMLS